MKRRGGGKEIFLHQVELHKMVGHRFRGSSWRSGAWGVAALRKDDRDGGWAKVHHMVHLRPKSGIALRKCSTRRMGSAINFLQSVASSYPG